MNRILYMCVCVLLFCSTGCYKDLGNYDYDRLPEVKIDSIFSDYGTKRLFVDSLVIRPVISFGDEDESSFDVTWYHYGDNTLVPFSHDLDLRLKLNEAGTKKYLFEAVHKKLGISKRATTKVLITSEIQRGFFILKETIDGNTDLDGYIRLGVNEYDFYPNLITEKTGGPLAGKPIDLDYWDWEYNDLEKVEILTERVIRPASEKDIAVFRMSDFAHIGGIPELFFDVEKGDLNIEGIKSLGRTTVMFCNGGRLRAMPNDQASRFQMEFNGNYEFDPMMCSGKAGQALAYDKISSSFRLLTGTATSPRVAPDYTGGGEYKPMNNWDAHLKFFGRGAGNLPMLSDKSGIGYALLEKQKDPDSLLLVHFSLNLAVRSMAQNYSSVAIIDTLPKGLYLKRAELYAMHAYEKTLFFTVGNRVYSYDVINKKEDLVLSEADFSGADGVPDEITYLRYVQNLYDTEIEGYYFNKLFVGGYKNGRYTLYAYDLLAGKPVGTPWMWTGEGKIKKMVYAASTPSVFPFHIYQ